MASSAKKQSEGCGEACLLAHNLNNKLAVILGNCELLAEHIVDPDCAARLGIIYEMARAMADELKMHHCRIVGLLRMRDAV